MWLPALALFAASCAHSGPPGGAAAASPVDAAWTIEGAPVSGEAFHERLATLVGPQEEWWCAETDGGGITSWIQADAAGVRWRVRMVSDTKRGSSGEIERIGIVDE